MADLQAITDAWGKWIAAQKGTSCQFTATTNFSAQEALASYVQQFQCSVQVQSISYDGNSPPTSGADAADELWYDNATSVAQTQSFSNSSSTEQSFAWSITEAASIGVEADITAGLPSVASSTTKISATFSLSSTQGATKSVTKDWTVSTQITIPPSASMKVDAVINSQSYNIGFTADVLVGGHVAIMFNDPVCFFQTGVPLFRLWFIDLLDAWDDVINNGLADTTGFRLGPRGLLATATGVFTGSQGVSVGVTATQYPLRTAAAAHEFKPVKTEPVYLHAVPGTAAESPQAAKSALPES